MRLVEIVVEGGNFRRTAQTCVLPFSIPVDLLVITAICSSKFTGKEMGKMLLCVLAFWQTVVQMYAGAQIRSSRLQSLLYLWSKLANLMSHYHKIYNCHKTMKLILIFFNIAILTTFFVADSKSYEKKLFERTYVDYPFCPDYYKYCTIIKVRIMSF